MGSRSGMGCGVERAGAAIDDAVVDGGALLSGLGLQVAHGVEVRDVRAVGVGLRAVRAVLLHGSVGEGSVGEGRGG